MGQWLFSHQELILRIGGILIVFFGLYIAGLLRVPWLNRERRLRLGERQGTDFGATLVGVTFGAAWTPCIGPALGSILLLASTLPARSTG